MIKYDQINYHTNDEVTYLRLTEISMHPGTDWHSIVQIHQENICIYANKPICHLCPHFNTKFFENLSHNYKTQISVFC